MTSNVGILTDLNTKEADKDPKATAQQTQPNPRMKAFGFLQHTQSSEHRNTVLK